MKQNKALTLLLIICTGSVFVFSCKPSKDREVAQNESTRPNIVLMISDDHAYQAVSAYGHGLNKTPNIDRLAKEGAIFTRACVTNSICAPSRAVILTGKHSFINGKVDNIQPFDWEQDNFAKLLQKAGYQTAMIGKIHLDGLPQGFYLLRKLMAWTSLHCCSMMMRLTRGIILFTIIIETVWKR